MSFTPLDEECSKCAMLSKADLGHLKFGPMGGSVNPTALTHTISEEPVTETEIKQSESEIRDLLMEVLFQRLGKDGTWTGVGKLACFDLRAEFNGFKCFAERPLSYDLPSAEKLSHCSDILISNSEKGRYISLEVKHRSSQTDQFKCRSYDIMHLKKTYGNNLLGLMVYVKTTTGFSVRQARSICYSFDHFFLWSLRLSTFRRSGMIWSWLLNNSYRRKGGTRIGKFKRLLSRNTLPGRTCAKH